MPDQACPRCGVPLHDQPDYCWSCGFYVGDRWRLEQVGEGDTAAPRIVGPDEVVAEPRLVSGDMPAGAGRDEDLARSRGERWIVRAVVIAALVIVAMLAFVLFGGSGGQSDASSTGRSPANGGSSPSSSMAAVTPRPSPTFAPTGPTTTGTVTRVVDGDTVIVEIDGESYRVRYIGMDTPETVKPDAPIEPFGTAAAEANRTLVDGRIVVLERDVSDTDPFDRLLRNVWVEGDDGSRVLVGLALVRAGLAKVTTYPPDVKYVDELLAAQEAARADGVGLWASD